jgi:hypothetical protein
MCRDQLVVDVLAVRSVGRVYRRATFTIRRSPPNTPTLTVLD